jgi:DNA-binding NtrC family response regulator
MPRRSKKITSQHDRVDRPQVALIYLREAVPDEWLHTLQNDGFEVTMFSVGDYLKMPVIGNHDAIVLSFEDSQLTEAVETVSECKRRNEHLPVICVGPVSRVEDVVTLMKADSYDCLETPLLLPKFSLTVAHAVENYKLTKRVSLLESQVQWEGHFDELVGASPQMQEIFHVIKTVAKSNATILILGESGTGKELVAKAIHRCSNRDPKRFIDINCGAIPKELLENELFGHERGAYTGADRQYIGSVERAEQGTMFLDEIGEMDINLQVKLLRLLQERAFQRIGGSNKIEVDIRVIASTNRHLREEVDNGAFREDLYYRLNVVPISLPPLRTRKEDIPLLAKYFLDKFSSENHRKFKDFTPETLQALYNYDWPGNIRELENTIERVVVLHDEARVKPIHLPRFIQKAESKMTAHNAVHAPDPYQKVIPLAQVEQYAIESTLAKCNGDVVMTAKKLQIGQATLYRKLKRYGIKV